VRFRGSLSIVVGLEEFEGRAKSKGEEVKVEEGIGLWNPNEVEEDASELLWWERAKGEEQFHSVSCKGNATDGNACCDCLRGEGGCQARMEGLNTCG